jgi:MoaA/NifB/PqqE/SkfB family radical SAM enzyme
METQTRLSIPPWKSSLNRLDSSFRRFASGESDEEFMARLYRRMLGRAPEVRALLAGTGNLSLGFLRRGHLRKTIASSPEYRGLTPRWKRSLNRLDSSIRRFASGESDEEFMVRLYRRMLDRRPDDGAVSAGAWNLSLGFLRRGHLRKAIASSPEYRGLTTVRESYRRLLGRDATRADEWKGLQLLTAAHDDHSVLEREIKGGLEYWLRHAPAPATDRSLAASSPEEIWLELTTRCNIVPACAMCGYASADSPALRRDMDPQTWRSLLPLLRQARHIGLHGAGEPLLYPFLSDLMDALHSSPAVVGFNSNGHLLTAAVSRRLVEQRLGWISISLDAATALTYLRLRRRPDFEALLSKIQTLRGIRDAVGSPRPQIEINMTLMKLNLPEAPAFVELASHLGLDRVMFQEIQPGGSQRVVAPDGFLFDYREQELAGESRRDEILGQAGERARSLGLQFSREILYGSPAPSEASEAPGATESPATVPPAPACAEPWQRLLFDVRGDAYVCCMQKTNEILLGRAPYDPLEKIWNGRRARLVREAMFGGSAPSCCNGCYRTSGRGQESHPLASTEAA